MARRPYQFGPLHELRRKLHRFLRLLLRGVMLASVALSPLPPPPPPPPSPPVLIEDGDGELNDET